MLFENETIGCENCKKCMNRCKLLPDMDKMLYDHKTDYTKDWEFMKKGVANCLECKQCDDCCPCAFNGDFVRVGGADKCARYEEETDNMTVLEHMEKGTELLDDILGTQGGKIPY